MTRLRRGFKTEANAIAREIRRELGLRAADPLDHRALADHLGIALMPLSQLRDEAPEAVAHFARAERGAFSAMTVFHGLRRLIVYNDAHSTGRQASDITHELSHALLQHPAESALDHRGCRSWEQELEEEADWLAGALLVSEEAALEIARSGITVDSAAVSFGVSAAMVRWRMNVTGAHRRTRFIGVRRREFRARRDS